MRPSGGVSCAAGDGRDGGEARDGDDDDEPLLECCEAKEYLPLSLVE